MTTYVYVSDEGAARAAAARLNAIGDQFEGGEAPPPVEWGEDDFGDSMREAYYKPDDNGLSVATNALIEKGKLAEKFHTLGEGLDRAVSELVAQDIHNQLELSQTDLP